jgi:hypothetical protein
VRVATSSPAAKAALRRKIMANVDKLFHRMDSVLAWQSLLVRLATRETNERIPSAGW